MSNIYQKYPWVIIMLIIFMSLTSIGMIKYSLNLGNKMTAKHSVLVDATMEAKYELTNAHLWLEEYINKDKSVTKPQIKKHIDNALWYLNAMIEGGKNNEGVFIPIDKEYSTLISEINGAIALTNSLQNATRIRAENISISKTGSELDIQYDELFDNTITKIDTVETLLQEMIHQDLRDYESIHNMLILIIILINIYILFSYKIILKFQKEWLLKFFKVQSDRDELSMLYKDLKDAQGLIDKYIPVSTTDTEGKIISVNSAMCNLTGYEEEELIGENHRILRHSDEKEEKFQELWESITAAKDWEGEIKNRTKCGKTFWVYIYIHPIFDEKDSTLIVGYQALRKNITDQKKLEQVSSHDALTGIYNRGEFDEHLEYEVAQYSRYKKIFTLGMFDLDHFKNVNDTYGHQVGDDVLVQSVKIMQSCIRESDVLARWGGEEFTLLLPNTNIEQAKIVVEKIRKSIENHIFEKVGNITISCGLSECRKNDTSFMLLKKVDDALYKAKESGRNKAISQE